MSQGSQSEISQTIGQLVIQHISNPHVIYYLLICLFALFVLSRNICRIRVNGQRSVLVRYAERMMNVTKDLANTSLGFPGPFND